MLLLKNEGLPYCVGGEKVWQPRKNGEKSCWPGLRQIDSSIDFPFTVTVHPSLLWLHWPISEKKKKIAVYYRLNQNVQKENTLSVEQTNRVRWNITYSTEGEKDCVNLSVQCCSGRRGNSEFLVPRWESNNFSTEGAAVLRGPCVVNSNPYKKATTLKWLQILLGI